MQFEVDELSDEQPQAAQEPLLQENNTREARNTPPESDEAGKGHEAIERAAKALRVDASEIRLAEMATFMGDFPGLVVQVNNKPEQWHRLSSSFLPRHPV